MFSKLDRHSTCVVGKLVGCKEDYSFTSGFGEIARRASDAGERIRRPLQSTSFGPSFSDLKGGGVAEYIQIVTTIDDEEKARKIQSILVEQRAAGCVQVFGPISSCYWWEGKIEHATEWICLAKARAKDYEKVESLIKEHHPYSVPEILAVPISTGNKDYLDWITSETIA